MKQALAALVVTAAFVPAFPAYPAADTDSVRPIHRVEPEFPRWAHRAGAERGTVNARLTLDADGRVTDVQIMSAEPKRVFDSAVIQALSQWRYVDGNSGRKIDVEIVFKQ